MSTLFDVFVPPVRKMLSNSLTWLDKAAVYAEEKGFELETLTTARLRPDQYPLLRQFQAMADSAKFPPARLLGLQPVSHPDIETSFAEIRPRVQQVNEYLGSFRPEQFEGAGDTWVALPFLGGKVMSGQEYICAFALPNFYFHVVTIYSILRHNGVAVGKQDFIGSVELHDAPA